MKKSLFILFTLTSFAYNSPAQISIDQTDFQLAGKTYISKTVTSEKLSQFDLRGTGENHQWDFSALKKAEAERDTSIYVHSAQTPFFNNFPNSSYAEVPGENVFIFYQKTSSGIDLIAETVGDIAGKYNPALTLLKFPANFGAANRSTGQIIVKDSTSKSGPFMDSVRVVINITHEYIADGWGTIKTPTGTFDALRVASKTISVSETQLHFITGSWTGLNDTVVNVSSSYSWFAKGYGEAVFSVNFDDDSTWNKLTSVSWLESVPGDLILGTEKKLSRAEINVLPNPSSGEFKIASQNELPVTSVTVYNTMGAEVKSFNTPGSIVPCEVSDLEDGLYTLKITSGEGITTEKLVIRK